MNTVYLAGPITGLKYDEADEWRSEDSAFVQRLNALGWVCLSPMRGKEMFRTDGPLDAYFDEGEAAVRRDLQDIDESDAVVLNVTGAEKISLGSMAEMGYAHAHNRYVIGVGVDPDNPHHHVFVDYMCNELVHDLETATLKLVEFSKDALSAVVPYAPPLPSLEASP